MKQKIFILSWILTLLAACSSGQESTPIVSQTIDSLNPTQDSAVPSQPTLDSEPQTIVSIATLPALSATPNPADWKDWPVVPTLGPEMLKVYVSGQAMGRDIHVVSIVGDCESSSDWFLKDFSKDERFYSLGPYAHLQKTIDHFNPSLGYKSYAAIRGATASTVLASLWADREACQSDETPLACEYRLHNPSFAFIALGTNDIHKRDQFEPKMRNIIEYTLEQGIIPILVTKADNLEGDESINFAIARLAVDYQLPVWNFWAAVQSLPGRGLQEDGAHLTFASNFFDNPQKLESAWPVRNLTALQVLEAMRIAVQE